MAMNGRDILICVDDGSGLEVLGSQRNATWTETTAEIDASSKNSRATRVLPGRYKATISGETLYVPDNAAYAMLTTAMRDPDGLMVTVIREEEGVYLESAGALVTSLGTAAPDQDVVVTSFEVTVDGWFTSGS